MIYLFIKTCLKFFIKEEYPRWYGLILEILATLLLLATLWFTSKAYTPNNLGERGYFEYLLIGELLLHLPFSLLFQGVRIMKRIGLSSALDQLLVANKSVLKMAGSFLVVYFFKSCIRLFLLFMLSFLFFKAPFAVKFIPYYVMMLIAGVIPFALLSLSIGSVVLFWGRGENIWGQISSWLSFLSGAYFPLSTFPKWAHGVLPFINPFALYLELGRRLLSSNSFSLALSEITTLLAWVAGFTISLVLTYSFGLAGYRKRGAPTSYSF